MSSFGSTIIVLDIGNNSEECKIILEDSTAQCSPFTKSNVTKLLDGGCQCMLVDELNMRQIQKICSLSLEQQATEFHACTHLQEKVRDKLNFLFKIISNLIHGCILMTPKQSTNSHNFENGNGQAATFPKIFRSCPDLFLIFKSLSKAIRLSMGK